MAKKSSIHGLDPRTKMGLVFLITILSLVVDSIVCLIILIIVLLFGLYFSKTFKEARRFLILFGFIGVILAIFGFIFTKDWTYIGRFCMKMYAMTSAGLLFALTTSPNDLAKALEKMKVPSSITFIFTTTIRFVPTLMEEVTSILDSLRLKGLKLCARDILKQPGSYYRGIIIPITIRSIKISDELAAATETRGFGAPYKRTTLKEIKFRRNDYVFLLVMMVLTIALLVVDRWRVLIP
ncbi:MAG: energy-coupling factor transporter transmembrane component T [Actinomycetota bacterium]